MEPIDYFFPLKNRGCDEPFLNLNNIKNLGKEIYQSRQVSFEGRICQKTYHRLFIKFKNSLTIKSISKTETIISI